MDTSESQNSLFNSNFIYILLSYFAWNVCHAGIWAPLFINFPYVLFNYLYCLTSFDAKPYRDPDPTQSRPDPLTLEHHQTVSYGTTYLNSSFYWEAANS